MDKKRIYESDGRSVSGTWLYKNREPVFSEFAQSGGQSIPEGGSI